MALQIGRISRMLDKIQNIKLTSKKGQFTALWKQKKHCMCWLEGYREIKLSSQIFPSCIFLCTTYIYRYFNDFLAGKSIAQETCVWSTKKKLFSEIQASSDF